MRLSDESKTTDNMKEILTYAGIWVVASIVTMVFWNKFVDHDDEDNWPKI